MIKNAKPDRRRLIAALSIGGIPAAASIWAKPLVNSIVLPAHGVTSDGSAAQIPFQLEGVWLARYVTRSAAFRLTINGDGSAMFFQQILTFAGIPINRIDSLELEFVLPEQRLIRWSSERTEIILNYSESFDLLQGTEQPAGGAASEFTATPI